MVLSDIDDLVALQVEVAVERAWANISLGATRALKDLERRETEGRRSKSMIKHVSLGNIRAGKGQGEGREFASVYALSTT